MGLYDDMAALDAVALPTALAPLPGFVTEFRARQILDRLYLPSPQTLQQPAAALGLAVAAATARNGISLGGTDEVRSLLVLAFTRVFGRFPSSWEITVAFNTGFPK